jgi:hypothetical protein
MHCIAVYRPAAPESAPPIPVLLFRTLPVRSRRRLLADSHNTDYLVAGANPGSQLTKAEKCGIKNHRRVTIRQTTTGLSWQMSGKLIMRGAQRG